MGEFSLGERLVKQEALPNGHWPSYPNHKQQEIISTKKELAQEHHRSFHSSACSSVGLGFGAGRGSTALPGGPGKSAGSWGEEDQGGMCPRGGLKD